MNISLYKLTDDYRALERLGTDEDLGENELQAIVDTLEGIEGAIQLKAQNVAAYALNLEAYAQAASNASRALAERAKRIQRRADALRHYLQISMERTGITKIEGAEFSLAIRKNPAAVQIEPGAQVPEKYMTPPPPPPALQPNKRAICDALKAGEHIPGCTLVQGTRLEIRT